MSLGELQSSAYGEFGVLYTTPSKNPIKIQIKRTLETNLRQPQHKTLPEIIMQGRTHRHVESTSKMPEMWYGILQRMYDGHARGSLRLELLVSV